MTNAGIVDKPAREMTERPIFGQNGEWSGQSGKWPGIGRDGGGAGSMTAFGGSRRREGKTIPAQGKLDMVDEFYKRV